MFDKDQDLLADNFETSMINYHTQFLNLLNKVYGSYEKLVADKRKLPSSETHIRDILVDEYFKDIPNYLFQKEQSNNLGRVDIYIVDTLNNVKPTFIIECKLLDDKKTDRVRSLNAEYIKEGIFRFLTEYYTSKDGFLTNCMIGFVVKKIDIEKNICVINTLSHQLLKNLVIFEEDIRRYIPNIYRSQYLSVCNKRFTIYHLMMDLHPLM